MTSHDSSPGDKGTRADRTGQQPEPRGDVRLAIYYSADPQKLLKDYAVNFSSGGVFIETTTILAVNTPLTVVLILPGRVIPITCEARVAWTNEPGNLKKQNLPPGMGLQFLDLSLDNLHLVRDFLNRGVVTPTW